MTIKHRRSWNHDAASGIVGPYREFATYTGTNADNTYTGTAQADTIYGNGGNDTLNGAAGNDYINGGDDNDTIDGGDGNDTIVDESGVNKLSGGAGNDTITSYGSSDTVDGGAGSDSYLINFDGGAGSPQTVSYSTATGGGATNGGTFTGIETFSYYGGGETDTLSVDFSSVAAATYFGIGADGDDSFYSSNGFSAGAYSTYFRGVEKLSLTTTSKNDQIYIMPVHSRTARRSA